MVFTIDVFSSFRQATYLATSFEQIEQLILNAFKRFFNVISKFFEPDCYRPSLKYTSPSDHAMSQDYLVCKQNVNANTLLPCW